MKNDLKSCESNLVLPGLYFKHEGVMLNLIFLLPCFLQNAVDIDDQYIKSIV